MRGAVRTEAPPSMRIRERATQNQRSISVTESLVENSCRLVDRDRWHYSFSIRYVSAVSSLKMG